MGEKPNCIDTPYSCSQMPKRSQKEVCADETMSGICIPNWGNPGKADWLGCECPTDPAERMGSVTREELCAHLCEQHPDGAATIKCGCSPTPPAPSEKEQFCGNLC